MIRKNFYLLAMIATVALITGCSDGITPDLADVENNPGEGRTISLVAEMPDEGPETRAALDQAGKKVLLAWEANDKIQLSFIQGSTKIKQEVTVRDISGSGKKATFDIVIPAGITGPFDLYGVHGGNGIDDANPSLAKLPDNPGNAVSLESVNTMLYFTKKGVNAGDIQNTSVAFQHLGSLFAITVKNTGTTAITGLSEARLTSATSGWAYNAGAGGGTFNLETGTLGTTPAAGNYISFAAAQNTVAAGGSVTFWGWSPIAAAGTPWPVLNLELRNNSGVIATTATPKGAKTALPGKSYWLYAAYDGTTLEFKDESEMDIYVPEILSVAAASRSSIEVLEESDNYFKFKVAAHASTNPDRNPHRTDPSFWVYLTKPLPADATLFSFEYKSETGLKWGGNYLSAPWSPNDDAPATWGPIYDKVEVYFGPFNIFVPAAYPNSWAPDNSMPATTEWKEVKIDITSRRLQYPIWGQAGHGFRIDPGNYSLGEVFEIRNIQVKKP